jgi:hypothetical protein
MITIYQSQENESDTFQMSPLAPFITHSRVQGVPGHTAEKKVRNPSFLLPKRCVPTTDALSGRFFDSSPKLPTASSERDNRLRTREKTESVPPLKIDIDRAKD